MIIELMYQDNTSGTIYDISELCIGPIKKRTDIHAQPGKLTFTVIKQENMKYNEGSVVTLKVDGKNQFYGYIFTVGSTQGDTIPITCYDQLRYLKTKDTYVFKAGTLGERFTAICQDYEIKHRVVHEPKTVLPPAIYDNTSIFDMINDGADRTLIAAQEWYFMRDNFGTLELLDINQLKSDLIFSDGMNMLSFNYQSSIDKDTFNYIKLAKDNKNTGIREIYVVKDGATIATWGRLQYFDKVDENANAAQIEQLADDILKTKNRKTETLNFKTFGIPEVDAGDGIVVSIDDPQAQGFMHGRFYFVSVCEHSYSADEHIMELRVEVSV